MNIIKKLFSKEEVTPTKTDVESNGNPIEQMGMDDNTRWPANQRAVFNSLKKASDFAVAVPNITDPDGLTYVGDSKEIIDRAVMDGYTGGFSDEGLNGGDTMDSPYAIPEGIALWYVRQGFIGYQMCAILAQHWLINKACTMSVEDSVRNGYELKTDAEDTLSEEQRSLIEDYDVLFKLKENLIEMGRFTNVFGVRVMIFRVTSDDPKYYEKPFNIDGVTKDSYKGISQIDPYWMAPLMTTESMKDPAGIHFYEPEFWIINGNRYHRTHLVITRGPQPADLLKPTYNFGGVPLTQQIYERVYAAERVANEAPLLATNKRTTALHVDTDKVLLNEKSFIKKLMLWIKYRDNHNVKILGKTEVMEQFDTSLADLDNVIMNQYQLVAAIAKTPATKILGTPPKGFNSTGEFETLSYHEELENIQDKWMSPAAQRHYLLLLKSLGIDVGVKVVWEPVDSMSAQAQADINNKKTNDIVSLITVGTVSPEEGRHKLKTDKNSGWNNLDQHDDAELEQGASPQNIALLEEAGAQIQKGNAALTKSGDPGSASETPGHQIANPTTDVPPGGGAAPAPGAGANPTADQEPQPAANSQEALFNKLFDRMQALETALMPNTTNIPSGALDTTKGLRGSIVGAQPSVGGIGNIVPSMEESKLPKVKVNGMLICIENPRGSIRSGETLDGSWTQKMAHHYGYIRGTMGADGDELDVFLGENLQSPRIFVVNQNDVNSGEFDEHKVMIGFDTPEDAQAAYQECFGNDWIGFDSMVEMNVPQFKQWALQSSSENPLNQKVIVANTAPQVPNGI